MESNFERVIHIGAVEYNLLSVVYQVGNNHFICRFCIDNVVLSMMEWLDLGHLDKSHMIHLSLVLRMMPTTTK